VPTLNEGGTIFATLLALQPWRGPDCEVIVVDGGSTDTTREQAAPLADRVITSPPGRARQMNAGAAVASGEALWFLHADTNPPRTALPALRAALRDAGWGRFDVRLSGGHPLLRVIEWAMNRRSRWTGIATGDQGIFVRREWFVRVGGFPGIDLMEDLVISRRLKRLGPSACLTDILEASSRRWERNGILRTVWLMWSLRLKFALGASPALLARRYYRG